MRRSLFALSFALFCAGLLCLAKQPRAQISVTGAGPGAYGGCAPATTPASPYYSALALSGWSGSGATLALNNKFSPGCATTAALVTENSSTSSHGANSPSISGATTAVTYKLTWFAAQVVGTRNQNATIFSTAFSSGANAGINLSTCAINVAGNVFGSFTSPTSVGSGPFAYGGLNYCKMVLSFTGIVDTGFGDIQMAAMSGTTSSYTGDGTSANAIWGVTICTGC
jgi:hypothetical protein